MIKHKKKCVAWPKSSLYCDGCKTNSTKCPYRNKYRDLRHTNYGKEKYHPEGVENYECDFS